jgi:2,4-dienoyl-CoA reductase-like NADH-dependent reductase (Old Yellow Enzyme family)
MKNYNVCAAQEIKNQVDIPVIVVGGIRKLKDMKQILATGAADYLAMGRPFIIEPDIASKFKTEEQTSSECISCAFCILGLLEGPVQCYYGQV